MKVGDTQDWMMLLKYLVSSSLEMLKPLQALHFDDDDDEEVDA